MTNAGSGPHPTRQKGPHAHFALPDPSGRFLLGCDLGTDEILAWRLGNEPGWVLPKPHVALKSHAGAGPRHFAFHPDGKLVAVANELDNTVDLCRHRIEEGRLEVLGTTTVLPEGEATSAQDSLAEIAFTPDGRFVYTSLRGRDVICRFELQGESLALRGVTPSGGKGPRHFEISADGARMIVANQGGTLASFTIDPATGRLDPQGSVEIPGASCATAR